VHEGLWIDDARQAHPPYVVMASPMDFSAPIQIEAPNVRSGSHSSRLRITRRPNGSLQK
jgi:hypothetical protein